MGGSSVLNYMIMTRGHKNDYDAWEAAGNKGWGYDNVLNYFMKMEDIDIDELKSDTRYHNTGGYMTISHPPTRTPVGEAFVRGMMIKCNCYIKTKFHIFFFSRIQCLYL